MPFALGVALLFALAPPARAALPEPGGTVGRARPVVELFVAGSDRGFTELVTALDSLRFAGFELRWERLDRFDPAMLFAKGTLEAGVHCLVDLSHPERAKLYCSDRSLTRFLLQTVPPIVRGTANDRSPLAQTLATTLDALLGHDASGLTRAETEARLASEPPEAEPAEPPGPPEPTAPARHRAQQAPEPFPLRAGAFYGVSAHSSQIPVTQRLGLEVALVDFGSRRRGTFLVAAAYELPSHYSDSRFDLALSSLALCAGAEASGALGAGGTGGSSIGGRLTLGLDVTRLSPRESDHPSSYESHPGMRTKSFVVSAAIFWSLRVAPERTFFARLSADIDPLGVHYDVLSDHVETVIERFRVRPAVTVGLRLW